ncbi:PTS sugar transporter subunit IIA [Sphingomonas sp.]|uniref:PTS sugar transporter subunit IIA n=1 Tax=Sphingomonas sp. TaxID=28214 RepID=UPI0025F3BA4C|nr:PTS sugar transporter subunit IIA [Sphingomonas sp.]
MLLSELLDFDSIRTGVSAKTKRALLNQLGLYAAQRMGLDPDAVQSCIAERERLGSTGFGNGVAIPHGKVAGLKTVYAMVVRLSDPIDFKAVDGAPVDIVFLMLSPPDAGADHLKALAAISRVVRNAATIEKLRGARSRDAFAAVLMGADERDAA